MQTGIKRNRPRKDRKGEIYNSIQVGEYSHSDQYHVSYWHVKCLECGHEMLFNTGWFPKMKCKPCWKAQRQRDRAAGIIRPYILNRIRTARMRRPEAPKMNLDVLNILHSFGVKTIAS